MTYLALKYLHVSCVVLSGAGFFLRGLLMFAASPMLDRRWIRVVPHLVDTVLLGSAVALSVTSGQYPVVQNWLTTKVVVLLIYILCGMMALKRGRTRAARVGFFGAALLAFGFIVSVALSRSPLGIFVIFV